MINIITFTIVITIGPQKYAFIIVRLARLYRMTTPCKGDESPEGWVGYYNYALPIRRFVVKTHRIRKLYISFPKNNTLFSKNPHNAGAWINNLLHSARLSVMCFNNWWAKMEYRNLVSGILSCLIVDNWIKAIPQRPNLIIDSVWRLTIYMSRKWGIK